jgi:hypothetical protein
MSTPSDEEPSIGTLLSRANLMRMRGQWDDAVALCTEAIRRAPQSVDAHQMLGDIYAAQSRNGDALQWYGMAADLAPQNTDIREKLDRAVAAVQATRRGRRSSPIAAPATAATRNARERTLDWVDARFPPGRTESIARLIFILCGILAVALCGAAGFFFFAARRPLTSTPPIASPPPAPMQVVASPENPAPSPQPSVSPEPGASPPAAEGRERIALPGVQVLLDPHTGLATVETLWGGATGDDPAAIREQVLRSVVGTAHALAVAEPRARRLEIVLRPSAGAEPLFTGEVSLAVARGIDPMTADLSTLLGAFLSLRWAAPLEN